MQPDTHNAGSISNGGRFRFFGNGHLFQRCLQLITISLGQDAQVETVRVTPRLLNLEVMQRYDTRQTCHPTDKRAEVVIGTLRGN